MRPPTLLITILAGCSAIIASAQNSISEQLSEKQIEEQKTTQTRSAGKDKEEDKRFADYPKYVRTNYDCIVKNINETTKDYVGKARKTSSALEDSIKKHGIKRITDIRVATYIGRLDIALERTTRKMPEKELKDKTRKLAKQYYDGLKKTNVSAPIDFSKNVLIQASQKKMVLDIVFYERLLKSNTKKRKPSYRELVKSSVSEKEYSKLLSEQLSALDGVYDAFINSRVGFRGLFASSGINEMRNFVKDYYRKQAEKIYPTKSKGKPSEQKQDISQE